MLSVNGVNSYNPNYQVRKDDESKQLPMRALRRRGQQQVQDPMADYEKQKRRAKIKSAIVTTATVLGSLGFVVLVGMQLVSMRPKKSGVLDIVSNEELSKHLGFDEMVQQPDIKKFWDSQLNKIKNADVFSKWFKGEGFSMLLYGPPGTGKTEGVYALKKYFGDNAILARIDCTSFKDSLHGSSEKKIVRSLKEATQLCKDNPQKRVIVLLDEMSIANKDESINSELTQSMQDAFKAHFIDLVAQPNAIVIGTTNHADKNIPLDTFMNEAIMSRFGTKQFFPTPNEEQFLNIFEKRIAEWEELGAVEKGFFAKNKGELQRLSKKMQDGDASFRNYWLGIEERIKDVAATRYEKNGITGDGRNIIIDDITEAVETCAKEENWGAKLDDKGFDQDDAIRFIMQLFKNGESSPTA